MINVLRKNQKALWIVIGVLCIPFVFYFSSSKIGHFGSNQFGTIYGRAVPSVEFQRSVRLFNLARDLGMVSFLQDMVGSAQSENEAYADFTWNLMVLRHETERLGLRPSGEEIAEYVKTLRPFAGQAGFDINKYTDFAQNYLPSLGFTEAQVEELAGDSLALQRVKDLIGVGVQMPEAEAKENYARAYGKLDVSVVRIPSAEAAKAIQISDDDVEKYFQAHQAELQTEEK
ncbi:MAG: SurA N-terminal domain-containing protein, partial [Verrucomicrobiota bacterium]|nr:SurA N-terminal domain-containing protein [Verrucomicrobiota bacterium]